VQFAFPAHSTQWWVDVSQYGVGRLQSVSATHCTHVPVLVSQWPPPVPQFASPRQATQWPSVALQYGVRPPHMPSPLQGVGAMVPPPVPEEDVVEPPLPLLVAVPAEPPLPDVEVVLVSPPLPVPELVVELPPVSDDVPLPDAPPELDACPPVLLLLPPLLASAFSPPLALLPEASLLPPQPLMTKTTPSVPTSA